MRIAYIGAGSLRVLGEVRALTQAVPGCEIALHDRDEARVQAMAALPLEGRHLPVRKLKDGIKVRIRRLDQHAMIVVT